jgi:hypothetical protein
MKLYEVLTQTALELGFPEAAARAAEAHASSCSGAGKLVETVMNRDLTEEEAEFWRIHMKRIIYLCYTDPEFREKFMSDRRKPQSQN